MGGGGGALQSAVKAISGQNTIEMSDSYTVNRTSSNQSLKIRPMASRVTIEQSAPCWIIMS